jgi:abhydrolase domain-containing protein 2
MSSAVLAVVAVILCILFRILNVHSSAAIPKIYCSDLNFKECIEKICNTELSE